MPMASITVQGKAHTKKVVTAADRDGKTKCDVSQQYWDEEKSRKGVNEHKRGGEYKEDKEDPTTDVGVPAVCCDYH